MSAITSGAKAAAAGTAARRMLAPLALTQFVASFAGSNMNVAISSIAKDLGTERPRRPDRDHAVPALHGGADDPREAS